MPFAPPWKDRYERGDLIYGIKSERSNYMFHVDSFREARGDPTRFIDLYAGTISERDGFLKRLVFPIWAGDRNQEFIDFLLGHPKYKTAMTPHDQIPPEEQFKDSTSRKVKGGLAWMASQDGANNLQVHFLLDGIDFETVALKHCVRELGIRYPFQPYTSIELRWVYRNRFDPRVQAKIQFWINEQPCCPPWEDDFANVHPGGAEAQKAWNKYHPKSHPWRQSDDYECKCYQKVHPDNGTFNAQRSVYVCRTCGYGDRVYAFAKITADNERIKEGGWCPHCDREMWHRVNGTVLPGGSIYHCHCGAYLHRWDL